MSEALPAVTVIIRTKGACERQALLRRAVTSVLRQEGVRATCLLSINAQTYDSEAIALLQQDPRVRSIVLPYPDKAAATLAGRRAVQTEFFAYLDDDDELFADSLALRVHYLREHPQADCVATNGDYIVDGSTRSVFRDMERISEDFTGALLKGRNWLASCGGTFRTNSVSETYFENLPPHCEWTVIAFRVATKLNVAYLDVPTYRVHSTPKSQSKTSTYVEALPQVAQDMLRWNTDLSRVRTILKKEARAYRQACSYHRINGDFPRAWHYYRKAVGSSFNIGVLPYALLLLARTQMHVPEIFARVLPRLSRNRPILHRRMHPTSLPLFLLLCLAVLLDDRATSQ